MRPRDRVRRGAPMRLRSERIVTPEGVLVGEVAIEAGRIAGVGPGRAGAGAIDLGRRWIVPGYIDTHVHGGGGAQCNTSDADEIAAVARFHARHGTTALLATTVSAGEDQLAAALRAIARSHPRDGAIVLGAHLEGPFVSPARPGALDPSTFMAPDPALLTRLLDAGPEKLRMVTVAPELPGGPQLIGALVRAGVVVSLGHSNATYDETMAAVDTGARSATHLFNAMRPLHHREPGVIGAVLDRAEVSCELICDGVHVAAAALRLALRAKGVGGLRLVTDAIAAAGMPDGRYRLGDAIVELMHGRATFPGSDALAGSTLTMDAAVRNAMGLLGLNVEDAARLASANPARLLGLGRRKGAITPGMDADLAVLDDDLLACGTLVGGRWVHEPR